MAKKKKTDLMKVGTDSLGAVAGGYAGNQITTAIESALLKSNNANAAKIAPALTAIAGLLGQMFLPDRAKPIGIGMTAVAGTETLEKVIVSANSNNTTAAQAAAIRIPPGTNAATIREMPGSVRTNRYMS